jgi:hypothetical protein
MGEMKNAQVLMQRCTRGRRETDCYGVPGGGGGAGGSDLGLVHWGSVGEGLVASSELFACCS